MELNVLATPKYDRVWVIELSRRSDGVVVDAPKMTHVSGPVSDELEVRLTMTGHRFVAPLEWSDAQGGYVGVVRR